MEHLDVPKERSLMLGVFLLLFLWSMQKVKGNNYNLEAEAEGSVIRWPSARLGIKAKIQWK